MTCEPTSSPTRPAASAPASTAAFTLPTSPRTIVVTNAPPIWIVLTTSTFAALVIASVASTSATQPLVSMSPRAFPNDPFSAMTSSVAWASRPWLWEETWPGRGHATVELLACPGRHAAAVAARGCAGPALALGHHPAEFVVRARDDVDRDDLPDAAGRFGAGVERGLHRRDVPAHERRDHAAAGLVPAHHFHVRRLQHRVAALHQGDEAFAFQQA